jgi:hypothetical protein
LHVGVVGYAKTGMTRGHKRMVADACSAFPSSKGSGVSAVLGRRALDELAARLIGWGEMTVLLRRSREASFASDVVIPSNFYGQAGSAEVLTVDDLLDRPAACGPCCGRGFASVAAGVQERGSGCELVGVRRQVSPFRRRTGASRGASRCG